MLADPETNRDYFDIVTGKKDYIGEALMLRANHRVYRSRGIQSKGEYRTMLGGGYFTAELGVRYHADSEDRFQQDDAYSIQGGRMSLFLAGCQAAMLTALPQLMLGQAIGWENGRKAFSQSQPVYAMKM